MEPTPEQVAAIEPRLVETTYGSWLGLSGRTVQERCRSHSRRLHTQGRNVTKFIRRS